MGEVRGLGAAQTVPQRGDVPANVSEHLRLLATAARANVRLLLFPELSLTGYELELAAELAFTPEDARLEELRAFVTEHDMTAVVGAPVRLDTRLHIAALVLSAQGVVIYTKQHLGAFPPEVNPGGPVPPPEPAVFAPGTHDPLLEFQGLHAALAICADTGRSAHAQAAADRGARLYLASMFFTPGEVAQEHARLSSYARAHGMGVVASNYGAATGGLAAGGHSAIWAPSGALVAELGPAGGGVVAAFPTAAGWQGLLLT